jgi:hypothetical protein
MARFNFNPTEAPASTPFEMLKPGWYACTIIECAMRPTKAGVDALAITYEVSADRHPEVAGRKIFDNLNVYHENEKPREISRRNLSAILQAIGVTSDDTDDMLGGQLLIKVGIQAASGGYDARNKVDGYKPMNGEEPAQPSAVAKPSAASRPWAR